MTVSLIMIKYFLLADPCVTLYSLCPVGNNTCMTQSVKCINAHDCLPPQHMFSPFSPPSFATSLVFICSEVRVIKHCFNVEHVSYLYRGVCCDIYNTYNSYITPCMLCCVLLTPALCVPTLHFTSTYYTICILTHDSHTITVSLRMIKCKKKC